MENIEQNNSAATQAPVITRRSLCLGIGSTAVMMGMGGSEIHRRYTGGSPSGRSRCRPAFILVHSLPKMHRNLPSRRHRPLPY